MKQQLTSGQKHILKLIARDADAEGWVKVSKTLYPCLSKDIPSELAEFELVGDDGSGRARLTQEGKNVLDTMAWL